jgi:hypothetical protein
MQITVSKASLAEITDFRDLFMEENNVQVIHNKCLDYGWAQILQLINLI